MTVSVPRGFQLAGVHCGLKEDAAKEDLTLVCSVADAVAAGVYTQNLVRAAPVELDRRRTPGDRVRVVVANSGNANACTGQRGARDAEAMARLAAEACGVAADQALVLSTGVIGHFLPMEKIAAGIRDAASNLGSEEPSLLSAARGILTTDTVTKLAGRALNLGPREVRIAAMAKGSGMIGPNMATMLGLILTDAALESSKAQDLLAEVVGETFNCVSVDGHVSTNDTVLLLANGAAGGDPLAGGDLAAFRTALGEVCEELARAIPADGEGATHLITIEVTGCANRGDARRIAKTVAESPLVKTAIAGADPNWGRIISAAGYAGANFDPRRVALSLNGFSIYGSGAPTAFDTAAVADSIRANRETRVELRFEEGNAAARFWTCDLTAEYVHINADYHT